MKAVIVALLVAISAVCIKAPPPARTPGGRSNMAMALYAADLLEAQEAAAFSAMANRLQRTNPAAANARRNFLANLLYMDRIIDLPGDFMSMAMLGGLGGGGAGALGR